MIHTSETKHGWTEIRVDEIFLVRVRNPETLARWLKRVQEHPNPREWALQRQRQARSKQQRHGWAGQLRGALGRTMGRVTLHQAVSRSMYLYCFPKGNEARPVYTIRVATHPPKHPIPSMVSLHGKENALFQAVLAWAQAPSPEAWATLHQKLHPGVLA